MPQRKRQTSIVSWDWKDQLDVDQLNQALRAAGFEGSVTEVFTNSDQFAIVVSPVEIDADEALDIYEKECEDG